MGTSRDGSPPTLLRCAELAHKQAQTANGGLADLRTLPQDALMADCGQTPLTADFGQTRLIADYGKTRLTADYDKTPLIADCGENR